MILTLFALALLTSDPVDPFVGRWSQGAADVEGYDTIRTEEPSCDADEAAVIERLGPNRLRRISPGGTVEVFVRKEGARHVWSLTEGGPGFEARFVSPDSFQLAQQSGQDPDWGQSRQHWRCPAD